MTLGLDASTTTCGWSICFENQIMDAGFIDISKADSNKLKSFLVIDFLDKHPLIDKIDKINLESSLSGFSGGFTSQQTLILLSRFNAVFEYIISEHYKLPVNLINVSTARKKVFGKARIVGIKPKDYVKSMILSVAPNIAKFEKLNKKNKPDKRNSDIYDSIVIGLF